MRMSSLRSLGLGLLLICACGGPSDVGGSLEVQVAGATRTLMRSELAALPSVQVEYHGKQYTGVPLPAVVASLGLAAGVPLVATAADGYTQTLAPEVLTREDALLAYEVDGAALPADMGPMRLVVPGAKGLSVKQLVRLGQP